MELIDTSEEEDRSINQMVLEIVKSVQEGEAAGKQASDVIRDLYGINLDDEDDVYTAADVDAGSNASLDREVSATLASAPFQSTPLNYAPNRTTPCSPVSVPPSAGDENQNRIDRVYSYVREHTASPASSGKSEHSR